MEKTVVGLLDTREEAERAVRDVMAECRCERSDIGLMTRSAEGERVGEREGGAGSGAAKGAVAGGAVGGVLGLVAGLTSLAIPGLGPIIAAGPIAAALAGAGIGAVAGGIIGALKNLGVPEEEAHYYAEGVKRGGTLVTVRAPDDASAQRVAAVLRRHGAVDIDARAAQWQREGWKHPTQAIPVVREDIAVGKREVDHGGVRIYNRIIETPVEKNVRLREEHVEVQRRPVDRPLQPGDDAFRERTIELHEKSEEPVVEKRARVVEEVDVRKQAAEREQKVRDTVRRTDVKVERTGDRATRSSGGLSYSGPERRIRDASYGGPDRRR